MKPLTLYPHEIRRLIDTGSVTVWRPMKQLKLNEHKRHFILHNGVVWASVFREELAPSDLHRTVYGGAVIYTDGGPYTEIRVGKGPRGEGNPLKPPHPPGSERWVRERCAIWTGPSDGVVYDDDPDWRSLRQDNEHLKAITQIKGRWKFLAARQMPRWASRLSVTVASVQARQVESITEAECWESGVYRIGPELETPLPVMACEEPQVKEGMAFGYRENPFVSYAGKPRIAFMFLWDGRYNPRGYCPEDAPQGWEANPWAWATKLEVKQ